MTQYKYFQSIKYFFTLIVLLVCGLFSARAVVESAVPKLVPSTYTFSPSPDFQFRFQSRMIQAVPGDVLVLEAGNYELLSGLNLVADNITIRGQGHDKTVLSFKNQTDGSYGLLASGDNLVLENFAVEDTSHNAIKVLGAENVSFRGIRTEWTGGPKSTNGAYGLYPVQCRNVLIENCIAIGAADAGIYVGQSTARISQMTSLALARNLRHTPTKQGYSANSCYADRGTRWVTAKTRICGSILTDV